MDENEEIWVELLAGLERFRVEVARLDTLGVDTHRLRNIMQSVRINAEILHTLTTEPTDRKSPS